MHGLWGTRRILPQWDPLCEPHGVAWRGAGKANRDLHHEHRTHDRTLKLVHSSAQVRSVFQHQRRSFETMAIAIVLQCIGRGSIHNSATPLHSDAFLETCVAVQYSIKGSKIEETMILAPSSLYYRQRK
jgi:hypothetical protein